VHLRNTIIALVAAVTFSAPTCRALGAQAAGRAQGPEIERVDLVGVRSLPVKQVRQVVTTRASSLVRKRHLEPGALERDVGRLRDFYWRHGFRAVVVDTTVRRSSGGVAVTFRVQEGPPTIVDSVTVQQATPALDTTAVQRALRLRPGGRLDLSALDSTLAALRNALWDAGYADAIVAPNVFVDDQAHRARVRIDVNPRWRTRVASIEIEGNRRLSDNALRSALVLRPGGLYRRGDVLESLRHLYESRVVASAFIAIPPNTPNDSLTPVVVRVQERNPVQFGVDAGLNTSDFLQVAGRVGLFAIDGGRWQLVMRGATGNLLAPRLEGDGPFTNVAADDSIDRAFTRPTWQVQVEATRLWAGSPRNRLMLTAFGQRLSEPSAFVDRAAGLSALFTSEVSDGAVVSAGYRFERAAVEAGGVYFCESFGLCDAASLSAFRDPRRLSSITLGGSLNRTNSPVAPSRGQTMRVDLEYASPVTGSEYDHFRLGGEATAYRPLRSWVLATHVRAGWAHTGGDVLHPRMLFYAGGSQSVRGYRENQLGPRVLRVRGEDLVASGCTGASIADGSCDPNAAPPRAFSPQPVGATALLEGSVELRKRFAGRLGGVLFADGATIGPGAGAGASSSEHVGAVTPGVGLRYETPAGAIRLDAGWQPARTERLPVVVETSAADGSSRLVRLTTERQWTPADEANGKSGTLRRITLHLAVGHAF
jgi:outer membrane protein assembly factor BamA